MWPIAADQTFGFIGAIIQAIIVAGFIMVVAARIIFG